MIFVPVSQIVKREKKSAHKDSAGMGGIMKNNQKTIRLAQTALLAALCYIGFQFFRFDIPIGTEKTAIHFGNTFCVLAALLLGGLNGGLAGAIGMSIADLTSGYATYAPETFVLKLCIGLIAGLVAHKIGKLSKEHNKKYILIWSIAGAACGMLFNVVADPVVGYFYKRYIFGLDVDLAAALAKISAVATFVNALTSVFFATLIYNALRPVLKKAGLYLEVK